MLFIGIIGWTFTRRLIFISSVFKLRRWILNLAFESSLTITVEPGYNEQKALQRPVLIL